MKKQILLSLLILSSIMLHSQNYFRLSTSPFQSNLDVSHLGNLSIGTTTSDGVLTVFKKDNAVFTVQNNFGRLQIAKANCNGCFHPTSKPGTAVFRNLGQSHNIILNMPNDNNDGSSNIRITDEVNHSSLVVFNNGKVTIGTQNYDSENYKLYVKDGIKTEKIKVEFANVNGWADYVFQLDYDLMPLDELEKFILKNKHLPEVPSAIEVVNNGVELKEMNVLLLKKVEELTLHLINLNDEIKKRDIKFEELSKKVSKLLFTR